MNTVTVRVPATSANLGPGFDCVGLALNLFNEVTMSEIPSGLEIVATGEGADKLPLNKHNLVAQAADMLFAHIGKQPTGLRIEQKNGVPVGSGMGSSSTALVAGMMAANELMDGGLAKSDILQLAAMEEGHPDNVAPAVMGGLTVALIEDGKVVLHQPPIAEFTVIIVLPEIALLTKESRAALPEKVSMQDAVFNIARVGLLIRGLETADYDLLSHTMQDKLHQPYRIPLIKGMTEAFAAVKEAGAASAVISGAGPSLLAFAPDDHKAIAQAGVDAYAQLGISARSFILDINHSGAVVVNTQ